MATKKYYAVKKGKSTGIFRTWEECRACVEGCPGAQYKGFAALEEAEGYLGLESGAGKLPGEEPTVLGRGLISPMEAGGGLLVGEGKLTEAEGGPCGRKTRTTKAEGSPGTRRVEPCQRGQGIREGWGRGSRPGDSVGLRGRQL